jgi:hypothetical protein
MDYQPGYVYHIKDEFFEKVKDDSLMKNKEGGTYRPTYFCVKDKDTSLLWMVPMSTRIEKYQAIYEKQRRKYGKCITIVLGEFDGKKSAFLLQNMFPITDSYLDHIHTKNGNPVPVHTAIQKIVYSNMQQIFQLLKRNKKIVFPDVKRIEKIMLSEINKQKEAQSPQFEKEHTPFNDILVQQATRQKEITKHQDHDLER